MTVLYSPYSLSVRESLLIITKLISIMEWIMQQTMDDGRKSLLRLTDVQAPELEKKMHQLKQ